MKLSQSLPQYRSNNVETKILKAINSLTKNAKFSGKKSL